jgi:hypothetical protein
LLVNASLSYPYAGRIGRGSRAGPKARGERRPA